MSTPICINPNEKIKATYFDDIDNVLIKSLSQNQDFFSLLLSDEELKRQVRGICIEEIYKSLKEV